MLQEVPVLSMIRVVDEVAFIDEDYVAFWHSLLCNRLDGCECDGHVQFLATQGSCVDSDRCIFPYRQEFSGILFDKFLLMCKDYDACIWPPFQGLSTELSNDDRFPCSSGKLYYRLPARVFTQVVKKG